MKRDFGRYVRAKQLAFLAMVVVLSTASKASMAAVTIAFNSTGLSQLNYNSYNFIQAGNPILNLKYQTNGIGTETFYYDGGTATVDSTAKTYTRDWSGLANAVLAYTTSGDTLNVNVTLTNTSDDKVITNFTGYAINLFRFPTTSKKPDNWPDGPISNFADFSSSSTNPGVLLYANINHLQTGGANWGYPVDYTDKGYPTSFDTSVNRLLPGASINMKLAFRFAASGTTEATLGSDLVTQERALRPFTLTWSDHRALGRVFLSDASTHPTTNPRGWFSNSSSVDVTTPSGLTDFGDSLMTVAQNCVTSALSSNMNGQGTVVWDIEGQQYGHPISYLGLPLRRELPGSVAGAVAAVSLPPEMEANYTYNGVTKPLVDHFFDKLRTGGNVGVCLRPTMALQQAYPNSGVAPSHYVPYDWTQELIDKITYAQTRWGCTIFYVDSNSGYPYGGGVFPPDMFRKVYEAHPDVLLIPEQRDAKQYYYGFSAPYKSSNNGDGATSAETYALYPNAFSAIAADETYLVNHRSAVVAGVRKGDILFYDAWWPAPQNDDVKSIYTEAAGS